MNQPNGSREHDIVLFGATGFTGTLTAEYLAKNAPDGCRWALAGRNRGKLEAVRARLAEIDPSLADLPLLHADVTDRESLRAVAESARVVITTVGPYIEYGEPLVAACADAGTDYVDLTGEPEFADRMYVAHHERAKETGARIVCAAEPLPHRRKIASQFGVTAVFDPAADDVVPSIRDRAGGDGVDAAFEVAGSAHATAQAVQVVRPGGTLVLVGYWEADSVALPGITAMRKGLTIRFVRRMKHTFPRAIDLVRRDQVSLSALITHEFPLADVAEAFARADRRSPDIVKAVVLL